MRKSADHTTGENAPLFLAGHPAPAGTYRVVETGQEIRLGQEDILPATLDGHVAVYERCPPTWGNLRGGEAGV